jgi:hypothetical protein
MLELNLTVLLKYLYVRQTLAIKYSNVTRATADSDKFVTHSKQLFHVFRVLKQLVVIFLKDYKLGSWFSWASFPVFVKFLKANYKGDNELKYNCAAKVFSYFLMKKNKTGMYRMLVVI